MAGAKTQRQRTTPGAATGHPRTAGSRDAPGQTTAELARVVAVSGYAVYRRGGRKGAARSPWSRLLPGTRLLESDEIDTRSANLHLALSGRVTGDAVLAQGTWLTLGGEPPGGSAASLRVRLARGSVYFDLPPMEQDMALAVGTREGTVRVVGTRFAVRSTSTAVQLTVAEGAVTVRGTRGGEVRVAANQGVTVSRGRPSAPRKVNAARALAWALKRVEKSRRIVVHADFDDGDLHGWEGTIVDGSAFGSPGASLRSQRYLRRKLFFAHVALERPATQVFRWDARMRLRFHYRISPAGPIKVQIHPAHSRRDDVSTLFKEIKDAVPDVWHTFDMPLSRFDRHFTAAIPDGRRFINFYILAGRMDRPVELLIDNIEFYAPIR